MNEVIISKDNWFEIAEWCAYNLDKPVRMKDGKQLRLIFENSKDRAWFALRWGL